MSRKGFIQRSSTVTRGSMLLLLGLLVPAGAGAQLFDFDSAPIHSSLPIDVTVGNVTAHFSATGQGFSIQPANTMGFTPAGFGGLCIYPNSIYLADLLVGFSVPVTDFSILYAPQELGCDDSAIMRVTAYQDGALRGTATTTAPAPGTWPTGTLSYSSPAGFNQVVVHYDQRPLCTDWGPIFMADNMTVTEMNTSVPGTGSGDPSWVVAPNPFRGATELRLTLARTEPLTVTVHDVAGALVRTLVRGVVLEAGARSIAWDGRNDAGGPVRSGVYFCRITSERGARRATMILLR
jgi:hypothetical protein